MNKAMERDIGYQCPVRGCKNRNNRRFSLLGLIMHMREKHGIEEIEKRLRCKFMGR